MQALIRVRSGAATFGVTIRACNIWRALGLVPHTYPDAKALLVLPVNRESFFAGADFDVAELVWMVDRKYRGAADALAFEDLIQEGNIGLMKATDKFAPHLGYRFSTYATRWIRQAIPRAVADKGRTIRVPVHMGDKINKVKRAGDRLGASLGRQPSEQEVARELGWDAPSVRLALKATPDATSLDRRVGREEDSGPLADFIVDEEATDGPAVVIAGMEAEYLREAMKRLTERARYVLLRGYGLEGREPATLPELGDEPDISRERVRQMQREAEQAIRHGVYAPLLRGVVA